MFSMFSRLPLIILGGLFVIGVCCTWLSVHDHNLRNLIIAEFNSSQEKLLEEKKAEFERQLKSLEDTTVGLKKEVDEKNASLETLASEIEKNMKTAKDANNSAAPYLKEIVTKMQKTFGEKENNK